MHTSASNHVAKTVHESYTKAPIYAQGPKHNNPSKICFFHVLQLHGFGASLPTVRIALGFERDVLGLQVLHCSRGKTCCAQQLMQIAMPQTTVGFGDILARGQAERVVSIFVMLLGTLVSGNRTVFLFVGD